jgi:hypothetical protein
MSPAQSSANNPARTSRWNDECGQSRTRVHGPKEEPKKPEPKPTGDTSGTLEKKPGEPDPDEWK